jgi:uncharacterized membrane protein YqjE
MSRGLLSSAQTLLAGVLALARTRLELFGTELQEELARLFFTLIGAMAVLLLAALGLAFAAFGAVLSVGEEHRALAAAAVAAAFVAAAFAAAWSMRRLGEDKPRMFSASLAELERDRDALQP